VGTTSVSSTLRSLPPANPPREDFDMFVHTSTNSLADQRKNVTYEDPQALGGLASALNVRQQNTGGVSHCAEPARPPETFGSGGTEAIGRVHTPHPHTGVTAVYTASKCFFWVILHTFQ
ncbi:hypothetical protein FKM82_023640, partial [Ascaphus truei]